MNNQRIKKTVLAGMLVAMAVVCSPLSIPIGMSKCFPAQHMVNVICGICVGPWYAVGAAFTSSLIRNIMGTGTFLAFPGSMCGAFLCGILYNKTKSVTLSGVGELFGTSVIGAIICYPIATQLMAKEAVLFTYVIPFFVSSLSGTILAVVIMASPVRTKVLNAIGNNVIKEKEIN